MEFYFTERNNIFENSKELIITKREYKHLVKVLRKKKGDIIFVTDGKLNLYKCEIESIEKDKLKCRIIKKENNINEPSLNVKLFISHLKNMNRFEMAIEKSVELGVNEIFPVITKHTINKKGLSDSRLNRLEGIITSAMEQSQRCYLPKIHASLDFAEMLNASKNCKKKIVMYESAGSENRIKTGKNDKEISLLIGPEGGFSNEEIEILTENNWLVKSICSRKLRAETAAIVSLYELLN